MDFLDHLEKFPPPLVRVFAKAESVTGGNGKMTVSDETIALVSGIQLDRVVQIWTSPTWEGITLGEIIKFCDACNFRPWKNTDRNRVYTYIRTGTTRNGKKFAVPAFAFFRKSPYWETSLKEKYMRPEIKQCMNRALDRIVKQINAGKTK